MILTLDVVRDADEEENSAEGRHVELAEHGPERERWREDTARHGAAEREGRGDELEHNEDEEVPLVEYPAAIVCKIHNKLDRLLKTDLPSMIS